MSTLAPTPVGRNDASGGAGSEGSRDASSRGPRPGSARARRLRTTARTIPLLPSIALLAVFLLGPIISSFYGSFTNASLTGATAQASQFVGLSNYTKLFADPDFPKSVVLTLIF